MDRPEEEISLDEKEIIEGWRLVKKHRKGHLHATLKSDGTQFYLEITPAKEGKITHPPKQKGAQELH